MSPVDVLLWLVVAVCGLIVAAVVFLFGWFVVDTLRGKR